MFRSGFSVAALLSMSLLFTGASHAQEDGSIVAWGYNGYGQCTVPSPNTGFVAVAGAWNHSYGLKDDGSIVAWGFNGYGQCDVPSPNTGFVAVASGYYHGLGLHVLIHVIEPCASTVWTHFETDLSINWENLFGANVSIMLYNDEVLVETLVGSTANTGSWLFTGPVPESWTPGGMYRVYVEDNLGNMGWSADFTIEGFVGTQPRVLVETGAVQLFPVSPNPSGGEFTVSYFLPCASEAMVDIYDLSGRRVLELAEGESASGLHQVQAGSIPSGVYICRLRVGMESLAERFVIIR